MWQHLPLVQNNPVIHLPATWSFGGILAARRFATLLDGALREQAVHRATGDQINELFSFFAPAAPGLCLLVLTLGLAHRAVASTAGALWWQALFSPSWTMLARRWSISAGCRALPSVCWPVPPSRLAGTLMQQVLRNPLASPTTLGVASGASWRWDDGDPARPPPGC